MAAPVIQAGTPYNITATGAVGRANAPSTVLGFFVNSTSAGTLVLRNNGASGPAVGGTITPAAGQFYPFPMVCPGGLHATVGRTIDVTFFVLDGQG